MATIGTIGVLAGWVWFSVKKFEKVYDLKNVDEIGLRQFIKNYDFQSTLFSKPIVEQAEAMSSILIAAQNKFVPIIANINKTDWSVMDDFLNKTFITWKKSKLSYIQKS